MAKQIGIDLGTSNTMIFQRERGKIVLRAPSVVAIDRSTQEVIASGTAAKRMIGKTPGNILALRPLKDGVITDLKTTSFLLHDFFERLDMTSFFNRPSALVCIPYGVTGVERRAVEDATFEAGAKNVGLIDEPIAAAVGAGIPISKARGAMIVDLGGGVSETAVISLGGVVQSKSLRVAGSELDLAIVNYLKQERGVLIGEISAERLKMKLGSATPDIERGDAEVCGRKLSNGKAVRITVTTEEIRRAMREPLGEIVSVVKATLEEIPPELSADILESGITLVGGGALLPGIDELIRARTGIKVNLVKRPLEAVCLGLGTILRSTADFSEFVKYKVK